MKEKLPNIDSHFSDWYNEVIFRSGLADRSPTPGCIVICPYGYKVWEHIKADLDMRIKQAGADNAAFPLLIPESFISAEKDHVDGFAPEIALVTHVGGKDLEKRERLAIRPTSETIIHYMFGKWISSWRDLPLKINQWCNVIRWEKRPRPFIRTREIWWQEAHTAHETRKEANDQTYEAQQLYKAHIEGVLAIPCIIGEKPLHEKFAGADKTLTLEAMMKDGKALQLATSHLLAESFTKSFEISFQDRNNKPSYPHLTSWGSTTRLIGAAVMVHGDQHGLVLPPYIAPHQVVIVPIMKKGQEEVFDKAQKIKNILCDIGVRAHVDNDIKKSPGLRFYEWETKGVPLRVELGMRDIEKNIFTIYCRDQQSKEEHSFDMLNSQKGAKELFENLLSSMHMRMLEKAKKALAEKTYQGNLLSDFGPILASQNGFYECYWSGDEQSEVELKKYQATIRCILSDNIGSDKVCCIFPEKKAHYKIIVAKAY